MDIEFWKNRWAEIKNRYPVEDQSFVLLRALQRDPYAQDETCVRLAEIIRGYLADEAEDAFRVRRGDDPHYAPIANRIDHALTLAVVIATNSPADDI